MCLNNSTELLVEDIQKKSMEDYQDCQNISSDLTYVKKAARGSVIFYSQSPVNL